MEPICFDLMCRAFPLLLRGAALSLQILLYASVISLCIGALAGTLTCRRLARRSIAYALEAATFILRAIPVYLQILIAYFVLPDLLGIQISAFAASVGALGLCSAGYVAQIVRCGINSIEQDQWEAAYTLGYSTHKALRYIIFPQMIRNILPALTNELDALLKSTAILASIGLLELTRMGMNIISREMDPATIYLEVAAFYVLISGAINLLSKWVERRLRYVNFPCVRQGAQSLFLRISRWTFLKGACPFCSDLAARAKVHFCAAWPYSKPTSRARFFLKTGH